MHDQLYGSISESFPDVLPDEICWPCFAKGAVEGLAVGAAAIAAIAAAPGWLAAGLTVGLAVVGAYGLAQLANNWGGMSDEAKSEALGNLAGGLIAGRFGGPLVPPKPLPVPGIVLMEVPGAGTVPVLVTTEVTATLAPGATVAAMAMGGGAGGSGEPPEKRDKDEPTETARKVQKAEEALARAESEAEALPRSFSDKTVASDDTKTVSGWAPPPEGYAKATPEQVLEHSKAIGHEPRGDFRDQIKNGGFKGKHNCSHAEKQQAVLSPNEPIGVSLEMCRDCRDFFTKEAIYQGQEQVVADPEVTRVFKPDGTVETIPRNPK